MYDELVKMLRVCAERDTCIGCPYLGTGECDNKAEKAADAIEDLSRDLDSMNEANIALYGALPKWIPVTEALPELLQNVLVSDGKGSGEGWLDRYDWHDPNREDVVYTSPQPRDFWCIPGCKVDEDHVTHWQPLPQPPKEEEA